MNANAGNAGGGMLPWFNTKATLLVQGRVLTAANDKPFVECRDMEEVHVILKLLDTSPVESPASASAALTPVARQRRLRRRETAAAAEEESQESWDTASPPPEEAWPGRRTP
jgi:hypothetical protein